MHTSSAISMKNLRDQRRAKGLCAECGNNSNGHYLCLQHKKMRIKRKNKNIRSKKEYPIFRRNSKIKNEQLAELMINRNVRISELAKIVGMSDRQVGRWISDRVYPSDKSVASKVAITLKATIEEVFPNYNFPKNVRRSNAKC